MTAHPPRPADPRKFEYLLNAMELAAQSDEPAASGYAGARQAVLAYVAELERHNRQLVALAGDLRDLEIDADKLSRAIRSTRVAIAAHALDEQIMDALGWERINAAWPAWKAPDGTIRYAAGGVEARARLGQREYPGAFQPSSDPVAFEALLGEIGRRGLGAAYVRKMWAAAPIFDSTISFDEQDWLVWQMPLNVKARAALAVLTDAK